MKSWPKLVLVSTSLLGGTALLLGGLATRASDRDDPDDDGRIISKNRVRIVTLDDDGDRHESVYVVHDGDDGGYLGVQLERTERDEGAGARVDRVVEDSPADRAGLREGDVITGIDGHEISSPRSLSRRLRDAEPGDRVELELLRDGRPIELSVELGERPHVVWSSSDEGPLAFFDHEAFQEQMEELGERLGDLDLDLHIPRLDRLMFMGHRRPRLGVQLIEATPELREHLGGPRDAGVLVSRVLEETPAEKAGVRVGDLIVEADGSAIEQAGDLIEALEDKNGDSISLRVIRDRRSLTLEAYIPQEEEAEREPRGPRARRQIRDAERTALADARRLAAEGRRQAAVAAREARQQMRQSAREGARAVALARRAVARSLQSVRSEGSLYVY